MSKIYEKSKFVEYLRETPLVSFACKKTGIARATYYRWYKDDREFREHIQKVLRQGRANINDLAEATLIKMIKGENFNATRFWLQHNNSRYVPVRTTYVEPITHSHVSLKPGETCTYCGTKKKELVSYGTGFYEREIEENQKKFALEARKRRKLSALEKQQLQRKAENKQRGIEALTEFVKLFPDDIFAKQQLEDIKSGKEEYVPHGRGMGLMNPSKTKKVENHTIEDVPDKGLE